MKTTKYLGIWMDNSMAHIIEFGQETVETNIIYSKFTHQEREQSLVKNENVMHNKEQHLQTEYYKELGELIKKREEVILFGPTNAKVELMNILKEDHHFDNIKIEVKSADKMTDNQRVAFVKDYFSSNS
ncbi:MAG: hypothetical protein ACK4YV_14515 [Emticicia sp.]